MIKPFKEVYECDSITMNLTNNCNLKCIYCFEKNKSAHYDMMSPETAIDIVKAAYSSHYVNPTFDNKFTINFFGGEPMLNWRAMKAVIDYCKSKDYDCFFGVTTNLTILTDEMLDYIDNHNIHLLVSIDGNKETHDKNRSNSFDTVIKNLQKLKDRDLMLRVEARMTILPENVEKMFMDVKFLMDFGIDNICPIPATDVEWTPEQLRHYKSNFFAIIEYFVYLSNQDGYSRNIAIKNVNDMLVNVLSPEVSDEMLCSIFNNRWCAFDTNGDIYPCHQLPTSDPDIKVKNKIGNIYTGVEDSMILETPKKVSYHKEECDTCIAKGSCKGGCPQENFRLNREEDNPSDAYCALRKVTASVVKDMQSYIMNTKNLRGMMLVRLKENLKIKDYIDLVFNTTNLRDTLTASTRIIKINEMINNLGEENIFPTFKDYFQQKLVILASVIVTENKMRKKS